jgi:hypothetical protein
MSAVRSANFHVRFVEDKFGPPRLTSFKERSPEFYLSGGDGLQGAAHQRPLTGCPFQVPTVAVRGIRLSALCCHAVNNKADTITHSLVLLLYYRAN